MGRRALGGPARNTMTVEIGGLIMKLASILLTMSWTGVLIPFSHGMQSAAR
jgi:hypothetical protein